MGSELTVTSLYRNRETGRFVLLRTVRPSSASYSQRQDDEAYEMEQTRREALLSYAAATLGSLKKEAFELVGELQAEPVGETLLTASGGIVLKLFYMLTEYSYPWIVLGAASSEAAFLSALSEDEELLSLKPVGLPVGVEAFCFVESDAGFQRNKPMI